VKQNPACDGLFHKKFQEAFGGATSPGGYENQKIGSRFRFYPATAVLTGNSVMEYASALSDYHDKMDAHFGKNFRLSHPDEVKFGYWGDAEGLQRIGKSLDPADEKTKRFLALGSATWKQVLSLSPAEPGLAPLKGFINDQGTRYISAGGWPDLQPVAVLKAAGCQNVVYITRTGGESLFAQGIAKRLLNLDRDWAKLSGEIPASVQLNAQGDPADQNSEWSRLFNLANPNSSYRRALAQASAVLCTNWNAFVIQKDFLPLIEDSYRSPFWIQAGARAPLAALTPVLSAPKSGCGY
jgi:hypothetical protein